MPEPTEVRPKVFLDSGGAEWRFAVDHLEVRDFEDDPQDEDDEDYEPQPRVLENHWRKWDDPFDTLSWRRYLESIPWMAASCLAAVDAAIAHPMTAEEVAADDERIAQSA